MRVSRSLPSREVTVREEISRPEAISETVVETSRSFSKISTVLVPLIIELVSPLRRPVSVVTVKEVPSVTLSMIVPVPSGLISLVTSSSPFIKEREIRLLASLTVEVGVAP